MTYKIQKQRHDVDVEHKKEGTTGCSGSGFRIGRIRRATITKDRTHRLCHIRPTATVSNSVVIENNAATGLVARLHTNA